MHIKTAFSNKQKFQHQKVGHKGNITDWFGAFIRVIGSLFPGASSLVQLSSEIEAISVRERLADLEDPFTSLHPDVVDVSFNIYQAMKSSNSKSIEFDDEFYERAQKPLAALEAYNALSGQHVLGKRFTFGIHLTSPNYIVYMAKRFESKDSMTDLIEAIDTCEAGQWLDGDTIAATLSLPLPLVRSVLEIYEDRGYGFLSKESGTSRYQAKY